MNRIPKILAALLLASLCSSLLSSDEVSVISGIIESSNVTIFEVGEKRPDEITFRLDDGREFVMFSEETVTLSKGDLVELTISSIQTGKRKLVCIIEVKGISVMNEGKPGLLELKVPLKQVAAYGEGCV